MATGFVRCDTAVYFTELLPAPRAGHAERLASLIDGFVKGLDLG
jgi:hypothetical protein